MQEKLLKKIEDYIVNEISYEKTKHDFVLIKDNHAHRINIHYHTTPEFNSFSVDFSSYYRKTDNNRYRSYVVVAAKFKDLQEFILFNNILVNSCL